MKNFCGQIGKAVCYFLSYMALRYITVTIYQFAYGVMKGYEAARAGVGLTEQELLRGATAYLYGKGMEMSLFSGCLTVGALWLFFRFRKKRLLTEANINRFPKTYVPVLIVTGIAIQVFVVFGSAFLPAEIQADYAEYVNWNYSMGGIIDVLAMAVAGPVVEEIIFRGMMLSRLRRVMPDAVAVIFSATIFALVHGHIFQMIFAFIVGVIYGVIAVKMKSILPTIILHMVNNAVCVVLSLVTIEVTAVCLVCTVAGAVFTCGGVAYILLKKQPVQVVWSDCPMHRQEERN